MSDDRQDTAKQDEKSEALPNAKDDSQKDDAE